MSLGETHFTTGAIKVSDAEAREHEGALFAKRVMSLPINLQERHEYDGSNQITYSGYAPKGLAEGSDGWMLFEYTWSGGNMTKKLVAYGNWTNRAAESYE